MNRVLFVISNMGCGGINRSLENLASILCDAAIDISVLAFDTTGQYSAGFKGATIVRPGLLTNYLTRILSEQRGIDKLLSAIVKSVDRITRGRLRSLAMSQERKKVEKGGHDAVIAFSEGAPTHFLASVDAPKKIAWIHCDFKSYLTFCKDKESREISAYQSFDKIVCVSDFTKLSFESIAPQYIGRVVAIPNVLDTAMMKQKSAEFEPDFQGAFNIVTVGRVDPVKRPSVIPEILSRVLACTNDVHWYIIGPTNWQSEYDKLISAIKAFGVADNIHLLGQKDNPYPYIKNADLLVNTSVSEACPYVINEAKVLGTPVVCTDFGSASQFVTNGYDGYAISVDKMGQKIAELIEDKSGYQTLKDNLSTFEYDNEKIKNQFIDLI